MESKKLDDRVFLDETIFRRGTAFKPHRFRFVVGDGGLGDSVCLLSAIEWVHKTQHQVIVEIVCHDFFKPIAQNIFPDVRIQNFEEVDKNEKVLTRFSTNDTINATGFHLVDLGFAAYCNLDCPPLGWGFYPQLDLTGVNVDKGLFNLSNYAIMTPGATMDTRTMPVKVFNGIKDYIISQGITPVFLGKTVINDQLKIKFQDYDLSGGLNLIDKTTLLESAKIISGSRYIVGLDNGLLHLAAMTEAPIVFGYNITTIQHRQPRRKFGRIADVVPPKSLECAGCQSKIRFLPHNFKNCLYKDFKCLELMDADLYISGIEELFQDIKL